MLIVSRARRERRRADIIDTALAIGRTVQTCTWGGNLADAFTHLLSEDEREAMVREREQREEEAVTMAQIATLMQMGERHE